MFAIFANINWQHMPWCIIWGFSKTLKKGEGRTLSCLNEDNIVIPSYSDGLKTAPSAKEPASHSSLLCFGQDTAGQTSKKSLKWFCYCISSWVLSHCDAFLFDFRWCSCSLSSLTRTRLFPLQHCFLFTWTEHTRCLWVIKNVLVGTTD